MIMDKTWKGSDQAWLERRSSKRCCQPSGMIVWRGGGRLCARKQSLKRCRKRGELAGEESKGIHTRDLYGLIQNSLLKKLNFDTSSYFDMPILTGQ